MANGLTSDRFKDFMLIVMFQIQVLKIPARISSVLRLIYCPMIPLVVMMLLMPENFYEVSFIGGDDFFETTKSFQVFSGKKLIQDVWTDHPPLASILNAFVFRISGYNAFSCRVYAFIFIYLFFASLYLLLCTRHTVQSLLIYTFSCVASSICSPTLTGIMFSNMLEFPAMTLSLLSYAILSRSPGSGNPSLLMVLSGLVLACALSIKFSAILYVPAHLLHFIIRRWGEARVSFWSFRTLSNSFISALVWGLSTSSGFLLLAYFLFGFDFYPLIYGHLYSVVLEPGLFGKSTISIYTVMSLYPFSATAPILLTNTWRQFASPAYLFLWSVVPILIVHHLWTPYWEYYYIHFLPFSIVIIYLTGTILHSEALKVCGRYGIILIRLVYYGFCVGILWFFPTYPSRAPYFEHSSISRVREYVHTLPLPNKVFSLDGTYLCFTDVEYCDYYSIMPRKRKALYSSLFSIYCLVASECQPDYIIVSYWSMDGSMIDVLERLGYEKINESFGDPVIMRRRGHGKSGDATPKAVHTIGHEL